MSESPSTVKKYKTIEGFKAHFVREQHLKITVIINLGKIETRNYFDAQSRSNRQSLFHTRKIRRKKNSFSVFTKFFTKPAAK